MAKNFFELVNDNFFQIMTGKYKEVNFELLSLINKAMEDENGSLEKEKLIDLIKFYFSNQTDLFSFEMDENGSFIDFKKNPAELLNWYKKTGWLSSEATSNFKEVYQMEPVAISILSAMEQSVKNDERPIESTGYVHAIYDALKGFDLKKATETTEQLSIASRSLSDNLRMVNAKIKKYLNNLLSSDKQEPKKILKELLLNYQNNVVAKSFNNLRKKDNPSKYKDEIVTIVKTLKNEMMDMLINNYIQVKCNNVRNEKNELEGKVFFTEVFNELLRQFETINDKISLLEGKNSQYVSSARSRVMFLLNDKENLEGKIDHLLHTMEEIKVDKDEEFSFGLYELGRIDETSLYVHQRSKKVETTFVDDADNFLSNEDKAKFNHQLIRLNRFTMVGVDNFILENLGENESIKASDIKLNDMDDFMILFLARIYEKSKIAHYKVKELDNVFTYETRQIQDYEITRRNQK